LLTDHPELARKRLAIPGPWLFASANQYMRWQLNALARR
jgi:hypothetical protein